MSNARRTIVAIVGIVFLGAFIALVSIKMMMAGRSNTFCSANRSSFKNIEACEKLTYEEQIDQVCITDPSYKYTFSFDTDEVTVGCKEIKENGYEKIIAHGGYDLKLYSYKDGSKKVFIKYSEEDIMAGKEVTDYCINNQEFLDHVGYRRCIDVNIVNIVCNKSSCYSVIDKGLKPIKIVFSEYNDKMESIFRGRYENKVFGVVGTLIDGGNEILINVDSERDQIFKTISPIEGDGSFTVKVID